MSMRIETDYTIEFSGLSVYLIVGSIFCLGMLIGWLL